jgi:glycerol-3-phosphate dehydrogenase
MRLYQVKSRSARPFPIKTMRSPFSGGAKSDLCIYGGTSAGVIAAVQAATMGKKVVLVEAGSISVA